MGSRQARRYADLSKPRSRWDLRVELPDAGLRLDRFMAKRVRWRSRTELQEMVEEGHVSVNGEVRTKASVKLRNGDHVVIAIPVDADAPDPGRIPIDVLADDGVLLAVNKRPGIVVHPVSGHTLENVLSALHARYRDTSDPARDRVPHICHRIDKETSGVLLVAFSDAWKADVSDQFERRTVRKEYLALVHGSPPDEGAIDAPILHSRDAWPRLSIDPAGLPSLTHFRVEERFDGAALVRYFPRTGRTHQIRVHSAHIGHPLLCDASYGGARPAYASALRGVAEDVRDAEETPLLERVALHAARLEVRHPVSGEQAVFEAPLPDDMADAVARLRSGS